jgi:hypothetical protein
MAIFMPSQIMPDVRSGLGSGTIDATEDMVVSWHINGSSAMTAFAITIYLNDANSTQKYTTGKLSTGCPAYGTTNTGRMQMFSYTITAASLRGAGIVNGNEYKLVIRQWWSENDSITQQSASVFIARNAPQLSIQQIGTNGVIDKRFYTFVGNYAQAQGDTLNWFRWQIAYANRTDSPFFDTERVTGTMDISTYYDGFFANTNYAIRLTCQTESGVDADTGWVNFSCVYAVPSTTGGLTASCVKDTDAVLVEWANIGSFPGEAIGPYSISKNHILTLPVGSAIVWQSGITKPMLLDAPWSVIWKGTVGNFNATLFSVSEDGSDITVSYDINSQSIVATQNGETIAQQDGICNSPTLTIILTDDTMYIREERPGGGLYPALTLYPAADLFPARDTTVVVTTYTVPATYTQVSIDEVHVGGYQLCDYIEILSGEPSAESITAAINDGDYVPGADGNDYFLADWTHGIDAGSIDIGGGKIIGFAVYRETAGGALLDKVAETDLTAESVYDYGAKPGHGAYTYYLFPVGQDTYNSAPIVSNRITPCWFNWTLMECEETENSDIFTVVAAYRFALNVETSAMSNNNQPNVMNNFTPYPKVQLAPQNYKSGTLSGLIGTVDWSSGQPQYMDSLALRDAIMALPTSANPLFLKNRKGDLIRIRISGPISMQTADATREQMQNASIPWVEVGSTSGVSLYALESKGWLA